MVAPLKCRGDKGEAEVDVLFDTGASLSFIRRSAAEKLGAIAPLDKPYDITIGDGSKIKVTEGCQVSADIGGKEVADLFLVLDDTVEDLIVGESTMRKAGLKIDMAEHAIYAALRMSGNPKSKIQNPKLGETMKDFLKKLFAKLSISASEDIAEDKAIELIEAKVSEKPAAPVATDAVLTALGLDKSATEDQVRAKIMVLQKPVDTVPAADFAALQTQVKKQAIAAEVDKGIADGKLYPHEREWALDPAREWNKEQNVNLLAAYIAVRPKVGPWTEKLPEKKDQPAADRLDEPTLAIMKQMGLSKDAYLKHNSAQAQ